MGLETQIYIRLCSEKGERQGSVVTEVQNESVLHVYAAIAKNTLYFKVKIDYANADTTINTCSGDSTVAVWPPSRADALNLIQHILSLECCFDLFQGGRH